ncbi:rhodanese-like domain protein [Nannochloropsis oceanica]
MTTPRPHTSVNPLRRVHADAKVAVKSYTDSFPDLAPPISATEVRSLPSDAVVLVDVRTPEERAVSMLPAAITQEEFERRQEEYRARPEITVVPYCTMGRRSGIYARKLVKKGGFEKEKVRNGEGILLWTHEGGREGRKEGGRDAMETALLVGPDGRSTRRVHAYGQAWAAYAAEGFEVVLFPSSRKNPLRWLQGAWEHLADKRRRQRETLMKEEDKGEDG